MVIFYPGSREDLGDSKTVSATANISSGHCPAQPKINQGKENLMPAAMANIQVEIKADAQKMAQCRFLWIHV